MERHATPTLPDPGDPNNRLLRALPSPDRQRLRPALDPVMLEPRAVLFEPLRTIEHVYFIEAGVASIVGLLEDRTSVEVATVGPEGMVGLPVFLGGMSTPGQAFMQVPGSALRLPSGALREEVRRGGALAELLGRYTQAMLTMIAQTSACNRLHPIEQRCARWLLSTHDRVPGDSFELTQIFLAQMLGVRRASVNEAARRLNDRGLIDYVRGRVRILDRKGLEDAACECYGIVSAEFERLLEGRETGSPLDGRSYSEDGMTSTRVPNVEERED